MHMPQYTLAEIYSGFLLLSSVLCYCVSFEGRWWDVNNPDKIVSPAYVNAKLWLRIEVFEGKFKVYGFHSKYNSCRVHKHTLYSMPANKTLHIYQLLWEP